MGRKARVFCVNLMMKRFSRLVFVLLLALLTALSFGQDSASKVKWEGRLEPSDARAGEGAQLVLTATIEKGYQMFAQDQPEDVTSVAFEVSGGGVKFDDSPLEPFSVQYQDSKLKKTFGTFAGQVAYGLPVSLENNANGTVTVNIKFQVTDGNNFLPASETKVEIPLALEAGSPRGDRLDPVYDEPAQPAGYVDPTAVKPETSASTSDSDTAKTEFQKLTAQGMGPYLLTAFFAGLLALLTPCVFPMIPVTVSYFTKQKGSNRFAGPLAYTIGIISTFTIVGILVGALTGGAGLSNFAAHPATNIALGALFVVLALSLFGVFEIGMPSWLVNKASTQRTKGGLVGPFFMGLTFSLTTFTCTVAFVGTLLSAAAQGEFLMPVLGMLVFSSTFAFPFFLLALFPNFISKLPRAGAWMNTLKASMGFLELIAAMKFFQNADFSLNLGLITREVFIASWSTLFILGGVFLLGWMVLPKLANEPIGWFRRLNGVLFTAIGIWLLSGLAGKSLGSEVTSYLPPEEYGKKEYVARLEWLSDYQEALAQAKSTGKNVFIDFTGYSCINCRWMEANMFVKSEVEAELKKMILVKLYTDNPSEENQRNAKLMQELAGAAALPIYVIVTPEGKVIDRTAFTREVDEYLNFLKKGTSGTSSVAQNP